MHLKRGFKTVQMEEFHFVLIDDDPEDIEIFKIALSKLNVPIRPEAFSNPGQAISTLRERSAAPDCIYIDLNMPILNGIQCLAQLRNIEYLRDVPMYIYTGMAQKAIDEKDVLFAPKPMILEELIDSLRATVHRHARFA